MVRTSKVGRAELLSTSQHGSTQFLSTSAFTFEKMKYTSVGAVKTIFYLFYSLLLTMVRAAPEVSVLDLDQIATAEDVEFHVRRQSNQGYITLPLTRPDFGYSAVISLGFPAQSFTLAVTALDSDTWVNVANSTFCLDATNDCAAYGYYNASNSKASTWLSDNFTETYGAGSPLSNTINGSWFSDALQIGTEYFQSAIFAVANETSLAQGFLGLGYYSNESPTTLQYANVPNFLYQQNVTKCIAWSIWLDPVNHSAGQLVFGGVDLDKFIGPMETFTVQTVNDPVTNLGIYLKPYITLADMRLISNNSQNNSLTNGTIVNVMPDAGEFLSFVPQDYFEALPYAVTGNHSDSGCTINGTFLRNCFVDGLLQCDCSLLNNNMTLEFVFSSTAGPVTYSLPADELIFNYQGYCGLLFVPSNDNTSYILGSNFLRTTYITYDFSHNLISMAPTNNATATSNVQAIPSAGAAAAGFSGVSPPQPARPPPPPPPPAPTSSGLSTGAKAGIGVGAAIGALFLLALTVWLLLRRQRRLQLDTTGLEAEGPIRDQDGTRQQAEEHAADVKIVPAYAINSPRQELDATARATEKHLSQTRTMSDVSASDQYVSTAVGSIDSAGNERGAYELDSEGEVSPTSIKRKPVGGF